MTTPSIESPADELKRLRQEEATRQSVELLEEEARELEELRLVSTLSAQGLKRGKDFEVVNTAFGVFGVKVPDAQGVRQWDLAAKVKNVETDRLAGILRYYVLPESKQIEFHQIASDRPGIVAGENSVGAAFISLIGSVRFEGKKKY